MKKIGISLIVFCLLLLPAVSRGLFSSDMTYKVAAQSPCPSPEEVEEQQALVDELNDQFLAVRAYKDATVVELARLTATYYSLRANVVRAQYEREILLEERLSLLQNEAALTAEDLQYLQDVNDRLADLALLLDQADLSAEQQVTLIEVLWEPVLNSQAEVSVERNERFSQRILEVFLGSLADAIEGETETLNEYQECIDTPATPTGIGGGIGTGTSNQPAQTSTPVIIPTATPLPATPQPSGIGS